MNLCKGWEHLSTEIWKQFWKSIALVGCWNVWLKILNILADAVEFGNIQGMTKFYTESVNLCIIVCKREVIVKNLRANCLLNLLSYGQVGQYYFITTLELRLQKNMGSVNNPNGQNMGFG